MPSRLQQRTILTLVILGVSVLPAAAKDDTDQSKNVIRQRYPAMKEANAPPLRPIHDAALRAVFPSYHFFAAIARLYPVARAVPRGLKAQNVFAVKDATASHLTNARQLERFFRANLVPVTNERLARDTAQAWLLLSSEFVQDGFYQFAVEKDSLKVTPAGNGKQATGKLIVTRGGNGQLVVAMRFDGAGKLVKVTENRKIRPGPRPICQATKLLDPDPIVRRMAEQDLLIMGRAAKDYLDEQRAKARPELRKAIDRLWQRILADDQ